MKIDLTEDIQRKPRADSKKTACAPVLVADWLQRRHRPPFQWVTKPPIGSQGLSGICSEVRRAASGSFRSRFCRDASQIGWPGFEKVLEVITADRSTFDRRDLERLLGKAIISRVERREVADAILARPEIIGLRETADAPITRYTTRAVLESENRVLRDARMLHRNTSHGIMEHWRQHALDHHSHLDQEQRTAFAHATGTEGLALIAREAGTGKSATVAAVRDAYADAGYNVRGLAWTNAVVQDMKRDGFENASTIASEFKSAAL